MKEFDNTNKSDKFDNLLELARQAKEESNHNLAAKYSELALLENPNSWEASFYYVYNKSYSCSFDQITSVALTLEKSTPGVFELLRKEVEDEVDQENFVFDMSSDVKDLCKYLYNIATDFYNKLDTTLRNKYLQEYIDRISAVYNLLYSFGDTVEEIFHDETFTVGNSVSVWKRGTEIHISILKYLHDIDANKVRVKAYIEKIKKYSTKYKEPDIDKISGGAETLNSEADKPDNLLERARQANKERNDENATKYYELALLENANSWEASFYSVYYKYINCSIDQIANAAFTLNKELQPLFEHLKKEVADEDKLEEFIDQMNLDISTFCNAHYDNATDFYNELDSSVKDDCLKEYTDSVFAIVNLLYSFGDKIELFFPEDSIIQVTFRSAWELGIEKHMEILKYIQDKDTEKERIQSYIEKIKKYDTEYKEPDVDADLREPETPKKGCYIATAVYGTYDCPELWMLRRFRDNILAKTWYGRKLVSFYYFISPKMVKVFSGNSLMLGIWKKIINHVLVILEKQGIEKTPYKD